MPIYTHTGYLPSTGRRTRSDRLAGHRSAVAGRVHALTVVVAGRRGHYLSLCGDRIDREYLGEGLDDGLSITDHARPATDDGTGVTCKRCLAVIAAAAPA